MPRSRDTVDADAPPLPEFPNAQAGLRSPGRDDILEYVTAVLELVDPASESWVRREAARRTLIARLGGTWQKSDDRPSPDDFWNYLSWRLAQAPVDTCDSVRIWGSETLLAALDHSSQGNEGAARIDDFAAILEAVDPSKLEDSGQRTLTRLLEACSKNWIQHCTAWEGFEQLIVPLKPLNEMFVPNRKYSCTEVATALGIDPRTVKNRIADGRLKTVDGDPKQRIKGEVLNRAVTDGVFKSDPRGARK
jgi:hypothetical protein